MSCACFAAAHGAAAAALAACRCGCRGRPPTPKPPQVLRWLWGVVAAVWAYVLLSPAGSVFEPLDVAEEGAAEPPAPRTLPSKFVDVQHLACGLLMQTGGLLGARALRLVGWERRCRWRTTRPPAAQRRALALAGSRLVVGARWGCSGAGHRERYVVARVRRAHHLT